MEQMREELSDELVVDSLASGDGCYPIVSQYYETPDRECYWEKKRKLQSRRKIRVRLYGSLTANIAPTGFIEVKHKHFGLGAKRRLFMDLEDVLTFSNGDHNILRRKMDTFNRADRMVANELLQLIENHQYEPAIQMRYDRRALMIPSGKLRITFDTRLMCRNDLIPLEPDTQEFTQHIIPPDQAILEIKSIGAVPYWFRNYAAKAKLTRRSFSKFATGHESHRPRLLKQLSKVS